MQTTTKTIKRNEAVQIKRIQPSAKPVSQMSGDGHSVVHSIGEKVTEIVNVSPQS